MSLKPLLLALLLLGQTANHQSKIIEPGVYRKLSDRNGSWLGLYKEKNRYYLKPCQVRFSPTKVGDGEIGTKVSVLPNECLLAVKNPSPLRAGLVSCVIDSELDYPQTVRFGKRTYKITITRINEEGIRGNYLTVSEGKRKQFINSVLDRNIMDIIWVGDLDRDGKLDFYVTGYINHGSVVEHYLHLSSYAKKGKLVGLLGDFAERVFE